MALLATATGMPYHPSHRPHPSNEYVDRSAWTAHWVSTLESQLGDFHCQASPHSIVECGAPRGLFDDVRGTTASQIFGLRLTEGDAAEIGCSLRVLCAVFNTEHAYVSVITGDTIHVTHTTSPDLDVCQPTQRQGFCGWSFLPATNEIFAVEDLSKDQRYSWNSFVNGDHARWRAYLAAPLIASNNQRIGTLCIAATDPLKYDAQAASILKNMAELAIRSLEQVWARHVIEAKQENLGERLRRSIDCYDRGFMFVDSADGAWEVMHMNHAAADLLGLGVEERTLPLQRLFELPEVSSGWGEACAKLIGPRQLFTLAGIPTHRDHLQGEYDLIFRPASCEAIDDDAAEVGIPNYMPDGTPDAPRYFFMEMRKCNMQRSGSNPASFDSMMKVRVFVPGDVTSSEECGSSLSGLEALRENGRGDSLATSMQTSNICRQMSNVCFNGECPFEDLQVGRLLGPGHSAGWVYRGRLKDTIVAVKVLPLLSAMESEGLQSNPVVDHPHIIKALGHKLVTTRFDTDTGFDDDASFSHTMWVLSEYCDRGTLLDAVEKGWFRERVGIITSQTNMLAVTRIAREIAEALQALHDNGVVHGALSSQRVLLRSTDASDTLGFCAKVGGCGVARGVGKRFIAIRKKDQSVTHTAPEVLSGTTSPTQVSDIYSLGVILWELTSHIRAWADMLHAQVLVSVVKRKQQLIFPDDADPAFASLAAQCMAYFPDARPTLESIVAVLRDLEHEYSLCTAQSVANGGAVDA